MSEEKKYLVTAAKSRKRHGGIWRYGVFFPYGVWVLIGLSEEAFEALSNPFSDVVVKEFTGEEDHEYTTEFLRAKTFDQRSITEILLTPTPEEDDDDEEESDIVEEPETEPEPPKKTSRKRSTKKKEDK